ncbi:MAG: RNA polymerase sigma factor [Prevotella sp.]|nr:RNA polymerase sigma factor [Prevotella sp.]MBQ1702114.1 RNA polymerase sigma factor [Prevotella sp.]
MGQKTNIDEQQRIQRILAGKHDEYAYFVRQYSQALLDFTSRMVGDVSDAEELAQDTFVKAYRSLSSFAGTSSFYTWLRRIAYHESLNYLKRRKFHWVNIDEVVMENDVSEEDLSTGKEERILLMEEAIDNLAPEERMLIHLYYYENIPLREIAFIMNVESNVLATRLHRIRKKLLLMIKQRER